MNRNTARSIIFGPVEFGGLNLPDVYCSQTISQLTLFLSHLRAHDKTGRLILISMSYLQITIGSNISFLHKPFTTYTKWIDQNWLTSLWRALHKSKLIVQVKREWRPSLPRTHDIFLMDYFLRLNFKPAQLKLLNQCRIYLQVLTLTDICSADGVSIADPILLGLKLFDRRSTLNWPEQQRPQQEAWKLWKSALDHLASETIKIHPLGNWLSDHHQQWFWYMDPCTLNLFNNPSRDTWFQILPTQRTTNSRTRSGVRRLYDIGIKEECSRPEIPLLPVTLVNELPQIVKACPCPHPLPDQSMATSVSNNLQEQLWWHPFYQRIIGPLPSNLTELGSKVQDAILKNTLLLFTDGSYGPSTGVGSHGWVLATAEGPIWRGQGPSDGAPNLMNPYRAELSGLVAGLHVIKSVCTIYNICSGGAIVYSDCFKVVKNVTRTHPDLSQYVAPDYDLLIEAKSLVSNIPVCTNIKWIKGHYKGTNRSYLHDLNELAHSQAKSFLNTTSGLYRPAAKVIDPPSQEVTVTHHNSTITSKLPQLVKFLLTANQLRATIQKQTGWDNDLFEKVDWAAFERAFSRLSRCRQISIAKLSHGLWNTNHQNFKYYRASSTCPCCRDDIETLPHVYTCLQEEVEQHRNQQLATLQDDLETIDTPKLLRDVIIQGIKRWVEVEVGLQTHKLYRSLHQSDQIIWQ